MIPAHRLVGRPRGSTISMAIRAKIPPVKFWALVAKITFTLRP